MHGVTVNSGGTFNLSTFKLSLKASNPISNSGTFNTTRGTVEYNGTSLQSISGTNVNYNKLRINNNSGTNLITGTAVNDTMSVIVGDVNLNAQVLTISPSGYLTETNGNTVMGTSGYITGNKKSECSFCIECRRTGAVLTTGVKSRADG